MRTQVPITGFEPDNNHASPGVITSCENLIPTLKGYKTAKSPANVGMDALASECITSVVAELLDGSRRMFAATADKIFERNGTSWVDRSGSAYAATRDAPWEFAQFGNSTIAATAGSKMQRSTGAGFTDLVSIKAKHICAVKGFVIAAGTDEATYGKQDDRWWCSALNDETDWTPSIATQCTTGRLVDSPGEILAIRPLGQDLVAYKDSSIYVGRYAGPPGVWEWRLIPGRVGVASPNSIIDIGNAHLFIGREDIYLFDGNYPRPLESPLKEWLYSRIDKPYMARVSHLYDPYEALVYFFYAAGTTDGLPNECIVYNHKSNKFGRFDPLYGTTATDKKFIAGLNFVGKTWDGWSPGYTWDTLPIVGKTWDDWPEVTYDSHYWNTSERSPAYFGMDKKVYSLTATPYKAKYESWHIGMNDESPSTLRRIRPIFKEIPHLDAVPAVSIEATIFGKTRARQDFVKRKTASFKNGKIDTLSTAQWHHFKLDIEGDLELVGMEIDLVQAGRR